MDPRAHLREDLAGWGDSPSKFRSLLRQAGLRSSRGAAFAIDSGEGEEETNIGAIVAPTFSRHPWKAFLAFALA